MISGLKHYASYLFEFPVEELESQYSGVINVSYHRGTYKLSTHHVIYSFGKYYTSFSIPFKTLQIHHLPLKSVLVLGLGIGSVINLLEANDSIEKIDAVEIDEVVIDCSKKYLQSKHKSKINYFAEDVLTFLKQADLLQYDLVLFDVFIDDQTPMECLDVSFLAKLKSTVKPEGILLFSKLHESTHSKIENTQFSFSFQLVFNESYTIATPGNLIYCWRNEN